MQTKKMNKEYFGHLADSTGPSVESNGLFTAVNWNFLLPSGPK